MGILRPARAPAGHPDRTIMEGLGMASRFRSRTLERFDFLVRQPVFGAFAEWAVWQAGRRWSSSWGSGSRTSGRSSGGAKRPAARRRSHCTSHRTTLGCTASPDRLLPGAGRRAWPGAEAGLHLDRRADPQRQTLPDAVPIPAGWIHSSPLRMDPPAGRRPSRRMDPSRIS